MRSRLLRTASIAVMLIAHGTSQSAMAQESGPESAANGLEEIIVTARRTEERLQEVPVAVTAFNQATLQTRNVTDVQSLANVAPGLTVTPANSPTTLIVTIRGLGNTNPNT